LTAVALSAGNPLLTFILQVAVAMPRSVAIMLESIPKHGQFKKSTRRYAKNAMTKRLEKFILASQPRCQMPDKSGAVRCKNKATRVTELRHSKGFIYAVELCNDCASYVRKHTAPPRLRSASQ